jgi:hypothetical protein
MTRPSRKPAAETMISAVVEKAPPATPITSSPAIVLAAAKPPRAAGIARSAT